jgi:hypothetical protein
MAEQQNIPVYSVTPPEQQQQQQQSPQKQDAEQWQRYMALRKQIQVAVLTLNSIQLQKPIPSEAYDKMLRNLEILHLLVLEVEGTIKSGRPIKSLVARYLATGSTFMLYIASLIALHGQGLLPLSPELYQDGMASAKKTVALMVNDRQPPGS